MEDFSSVIFRKAGNKNKLCLKKFKEGGIENAFFNAEYPEEPKVIDISKDSKSVRLDIYL